MGMEYEPGTAFFFLMVLVTVQLGMMNLILSVIVDKAQQAQAEDEEYQVHQKELEAEQVKKTLLVMMHNLDTDSDGQLSFEEIITGFDMNPTFRQQMLLLDVQREDLDEVFKVMDVTR